MWPLPSPLLPFVQTQTMLPCAQKGWIVRSHACTNDCNTDFNVCISFVLQITRNHYQNALTATRMESSPQTPDALYPNAKARPPGPEARSNSIALPLMSTHTRLGLTRFAHLHPRGGLRNTSQLNERNRIVRKFCTRLYWTKGYVKKGMRVVIVWCYFPNHE